MNSKKFYLNFVIFFGTLGLWAVLDVLTGKTTDQTITTIVAFFLVWNMNACEEKKPRKSKAPSSDFTQQL